MSSKLSGQIKFYDDKKGFGFIVPEIGGSDVFFHVSNVVGNPIDNSHKNCKVSFDVATNKKGPHAVNVSLEF